jgi:16S rRNA (cytidine1402-2'-O)-methyltransferase
MSVRGQNTRQMRPRIIRLLQNEQAVAYISDAGTPGISDPGSALVRGVREAGFPVVPIPGASASSALLSVSGLPGRGWFFEGFLPPKGTRRTTRLQELAQRGEPFMLYESPHRIRKLFDELCVAAPEFRVIIGREMTKIYEQIIEVSVETGKEMVETGDIPARGEFVLLVWSGKRR